MEIILAYMRSLHNYIIIIKLTDLKYLNYICQKKQKNDKVLNCSSKIFCQLDEL